MDIRLVCDYLPRPAGKAIESLNLTTLEELSKYTEQDLRQLHGIGTSAIKIIKMILESHELTLQEQQ
ncbi:MAG: hypothetical protein ACRDBX_01370 [Erysipelotrichaceae bacterium]